jgi:hypothetical protein
VVEVALGGAGITGESCLTPPSGLVAWWPGDGHANDIWGANHGALNGGATFSPGMVGQAFSLDGRAGSRIVVGDNNALDLVNMTVEAWIFVRSIDRLWDRIICKAGPQQRADLADFAGYELAIGGTAYPPPGRPAGFAWASFTLHDGTQTLNAFSTTALQTNTWYHLVGTYNNSTKIVRLFLNGVQEGSATNALFGAPLITENPLYFGFEPYYGPIALSFNGLIDEVQVYNRALSASEIQALYAAGSAGKCKDTGPPVIVAQPQSQAANAGDDVTLTVVAGGTKLVDYQWRFNGVNLPGATNSALVLTNVQPAQAGIYAVAVSNALGSVTSSNATLTVTLPELCVTAPTGLIGWWPGDNHANDIWGANHGVPQGGVLFASGHVRDAFSFDGIDDYVEITNASFPSGNVPITIEFWMRGVPGGPANDRAVAIGASAQHQSILIGEQKGNNHIRMIATLSTECESTSVVFDNKFHHIAAVYDQASLRLYVDGLLESSCPYSSLNLAGSVITIGQQGSGARMSWTYFHGLIDELSIYSRALSAGQIQALYAAGSVGKCKATNAPVIFAQPQDQTTKAGDIASFSVLAGGTPPLSYQWRFNGANLAGATNPTLLLTKVQAGQDGNYSVVVSNSYGAVTSAVARLTVVVWLSLVGQQHGQRGADSDFHQQR